MSDDCCKHKRINRKIIIILFIGLIVLFFAAPSPAAPSALSDFNDHFAKMIKVAWHKPVSIHGISTTVFDYRLIAEQAKKSGSDFNLALGALKKIDLKLLPPGNIEKVFWINVYNFAAMKMVAGHYPIDSIRSMKISLIRHPWSKDAISIGKKDYSLSEIEHDILLKKYSDTRIIFAVSCAAVSCPDRTDEIFTPTKYEQQIDAMIRAFFTNQKKGLSLKKEKKTLTLSWILKKDAKLFRPHPLDFVLKYVDDDNKVWILKNRDQLKVEYFEHDWALNDLALQDQ